MYEIGKDFWFIENTDSTKYKYVLSVKITTEDDSVLTWKFGINSQKVAENKKQLNESISVYIRSHRRDAKDLALSLVEYE